MKIVKTASKNVLSLSKSEWVSIGKKAGWFKSASLENINPNNIKIISRSEIMGIISSIGSKRFKLGYVKKDGSFREIEAQKRVNKYKYSPSTGDVPEGLIVVYDLKVANQIASSLNLDILNPDGTVNDEKAAIKEKELRNAYRRIYPENIELIKIGQSVWVVDDPVSDEVVSLLERE